MADNKFIYDYSNLFSDKIGTPNGINIDEITRINDKINMAYAQVFENPTAEHQIIYDCLENIDLQKIKELALAVRDSCDNFVIFGIGGSSLGASALFEALCVPNYNELPREKRRAPKFYVVDSIAPAGFLGLMNFLDLNKTIFCVVSKSGKTTETMAQFFYAREMCEKQFGDKWGEHFVVLTDEADNFLNNYADKFGLKKLFIPVKLGGRYSVLSAVGMFPAAVLGYDVEAIIDGAKQMLAAGRERDVFGNAPLLSAVCNFINYQKGKNMCVVVPYSAKLSVFDDWFCQLWGESIGRNKNRAGQDLTGVARVGQTPIQVTGPSVQHSQFQLYLEGPDDKIFTFLGVQNCGIDGALPAELDELFGQNVSEGKTFGDLLNIERQASTLALTEFHKPSETITIERLNEQSMGKLMMFFILKMLFTGALLNITPFGQPAVESIKKEIARILKGVPSAPRDKIIEI